jgi:hypothetical protein
VKSTTATATRIAYTILANNAWSSTIVRLTLRQAQGQALADKTDLFSSANRLVWQAEGITRIRRHRWPVEVYHEEGKAEGLDKYQLRNFSAIQRHVALVAVVYSLLRAAQHDRVLHEQLQRQLNIDIEGTPVSWRRAAQAQNLWRLGLLISNGLAQGQSLQELIAPFIQAICRV